MNPYPAQRTARAVETLSGLLADGGMTVLLVEHDMEVVFSLANKITVLHPARSSPRIIVSVPGRNGVGRTTTARGDGAGAADERPCAAGRGRDRRLGAASHGAPGRLCARGQAHLPDLTVVEDIQVAERRPARAWPLARLFELFPALRVRARAICRSPLPRAAAPQTRPNRRFPSRGPYWPRRCRCRSARRPRSDTAWPPAPPNSCGAARDRRRRSPVR